MILCTVRACLDAVIWQVRELVVLAVILFHAGYTLALLFLLLLFCTYLIILLVIIINSPYRNPKAEHFNIDKTPYL